MKTYTIDEIKKAKNILIERYKTFLKDEYVQTAKANLEDLINILIVEMGQ